MKICLLSNLLPPIHTGSSLFTWNLATRLAARGHRIVVIGARIPGTPRHEEKEGVVIHRLPSIPLPRLAIAHNFRWLTYTFTPANLRWLAALFEKEQFEVIHQNNHIFDTMLSAVRMSRRFDLPILMTIHTLVQHTNKTFNTILSGMDWVSRKLVLENMDCVVSPDPVTAHYLREKHHIQASPVIPYGIEVAPAKVEDVAALREKYHLGGGFVILSLGHVHPLRDRLDLIQAMPRILQRFPETKVLIVGDVLVQRPVEAVRELNLEDRVIFTGPLPHEQISALLALSTLEAHTFNSYFTAPGIASMEAMAAGLPVVTGKIPAEFDFPDLEDGQNIVMIPPGQPDRMAAAILQLLSDESLRRRIGENARQTLADHYSWDAVCRAYEDIYQQLAGRPRVRPGSPVE